MVLRFYAAAPQI